MARCQYQMPPESLNDIDALFDAPSSSRKPTAAPSAPVIESRREVRAKANWAARVLLPDGSVREVRLRDLAQAGVGFVSQHAVPQHQVLKVAVAVPHFEEFGKLIPVSGAIRITHTTFRGADIYFGGPWVSLSTEATELLQRWIRKLSATVP